MELFLVGKRMNIEIDGYNIAYDISGEGEKTAVMLQGWGTHFGIYDSVAAALPEDYRFIRFDFPGFGGSDEPREVWGVDEYADFFLRLMERLEVKEALLLGHSYGGRVIIKLASRRELPFKIERIVLIDSAGIMPKKTFKKQVKVRTYKILKALFSLKFIHFLFPEIIDDWKSRQGSEDYRNASPMMKKVLVKSVNEDLINLLPLISQETLLIWGDKDTATPLSDAKIMESKIPGSGLAVISGTGHYSFLENPVVFRNIMKAFLA